MSTSRGAPSSDGADPTRDRYGSLLRSLRTGEAAPSEAAPRARSPHPRSWHFWGHWHPITRWLLVAVVVSVVAYGALVLVDRVAREGSVRTWTGPDASVRSGHRLAGCPEASDLGDGTYPSWVRWGGAVYRFSDALRPIGLRTGVGETGFTESGYSLDRLRILLVDDTERGRAREYILLVQPPATAGHVYERTDCAWPSA